MNHENQLEQLKQMGPCSLHSRIEVDMQKYSFTHWEVLGMVAMPYQTKVAIIMERVGHKKKHQLLTGSIGGEWVHC
jgi:hypothetical protein